ncbi:hypothetical protein [Mycolicibacter kumamotonensis]|uniref:Uncharacterized protein n=1 Tax=Mycolicibacter kumamotonensis TaxID=354243 RepID=A0A1B8SL77_9MYCO|nr:hypothetical protein [Mycolicibacter kumamotonensis]OBY33516.1 hypothetical protein ACT18_00845 [Mycolicibacter kumamotonensis]
MSQLTLSSTLGSFKLNCVRISTLLYSDMSSVQTRWMQQHFPTKQEQPQVTFDLQFTNELLFQQFQTFVRMHHLSALSTVPTTTAAVTLWWPERDINNWTGLITNFKGGGMRFNPAPRAQLSVDLIDSVFSQGAAAASVGATWLSVVGYGSTGVMNLPSAASLRPVQHPTDGQYVTSDDGTQRGQDSR